MPRPAGGKKNTHHHKHEGGLVGPGKKVTKQKSGGQLNGNHKAAVPGEPLPGTVSQTPMNFQANNVSTSSLSEPIGTPPIGSRRGVLKKQDSEESYDVLADRSAPLQGSTDDPAPGSQSLSNKSRHVPAFSHLQIAASILRTSPICDTLAILIFLLGLPSIVLTIVQALFASLTLMPPSGVSAGSLLSFLDGFQGSAGPPSLATMAIMDALCLAAWLCLWNWARSFALDFAQIHIALTLGSGNSMKDGQMNTICTAIVLLLHTIRSKGVRNFVYGRLIPAKLLTHGTFAQLAHLLPEERDMGHSDELVNWLPSLFAIHIISQAIMAVVRRRVSSTSSESSTSTKSSRRVDPEAATTNVHQDSNIANHTVVSTGVDGISSLSSNLKDNKDKVPSAKRKRRQANQVRSRQPFWAAVASTKVHVLREYEQKVNLSKAVGTLEGTLDVSDSDERVWVTHVDPASICFEAANISLPVHDQESSLPKHSRPFFIRINGARWQAVYLDPVTPLDSDERMTHWSGEISGLAPNCTYTCTFVRVDNDEDFAVLVVKTPPIDEKDVANTQAPASARQALRPSSPTSGLRTSIAGAELKLSEARNRLLKSKRAHKAGMTKHERDVETLSSRLKSSSDDNKQRQKLLQAEQSIRRTEDATTSITSALDDLAAIPEEEHEEFGSRRQSFEKRRELLAAANETLAAAKTSAKGELSCVQKDLTSHTDRRERLASRQARLVEQHDRINHANAKGMNEKDRREAESVAKHTDHQRVEGDYLQYFHSFNQDIHQLREKTSRSWEEIHNYDRQAQGQREAMLRNSGPLTPEGFLPGTNPNPQLPASSRPFNFGFQPPPMLPIPGGPHSPEMPQVSPFLPMAKTISNSFGVRPRSMTNRSLGAGSNYSLEYEDPDPIPPMPSNIDFVEGIGRRGSLNNGRDNSNGSPGVIGGGIPGSPARANHSSPSNHSQGPGGSNHVNTW